jgi:hypothetical protein
MQEGPAAGAGQVNAVKDGRHGVLAIFDGALHAEVIL